MMKKNNKKGFTLAELLIVVAIIAVLTAIAIPVFTNQLEKSREATDAANSRSAYAEVVAKALETPDSDHSATVTKKQTKDNWESELDIAGDSTNNITGGAGDITVAYTASDGLIKIDGQTAKSSFMNASSSSDS